MDESSPHSHAAVWRRRTRSTVRVAVSARVRVPVAVAVGVPVAVGVAVAVEMAVLVQQETHAKGVRKRTDRVQSEELMQNMCVS